MKRTECLQEAQVLGSVSAHSEDMLTAMKMKNWPV